MSDGTGGYTHASEARIDRDGPAPPEGPVDMGAGYIRTPPPTRRRRLLDACGWVALVYALLLLATALVVFAGARHARLLDNLSNLPHLWWWAAWPVVPGLLCMGPGWRRTLAGLCVVALLLHHGAACAPYLGWSADGETPRAHVSFASAGAAGVSEREAWRRGDAPLRLRVATLNLQKHAADPVRAAAWVDELQPDLIVFQEVPVEWVEGMAARRTAYPAQERSTILLSGGIFVVSRYPIARVVEFHPARHWMAALVLRIRLRGRAFTVLCPHPYAPLASGDRWRRRNQQLRELASWRGPDLLVVGDLNLTMFSPFYEDYRAATALRNARRGRGIHPTWPAALALYGVGVPIDHVLHGEAWRAVACGRGPDLGSDHLPFWADLEWTPSPEASRLE